jgi:NADH dehydrogenase
MIVVTGGSGYVGSHIVKRLAGNGKPVRAMVRSKARTQNEGRLSGLDVELIDGDVTKPESLKPAFENAEAVIHTVAIAIEKGDLTYEEINTIGTVNVLEAARNAGTGRFINLSQLGADSRLPYRFLASKGRAQEYVAESDLDWTAFRPSVIWGPEDEFANTFAKLAAITPIIFPNVDKNARFEPVWVEDVVTCLVTSLDNQDTIGKEYEIGGPEVLSLEQIERRTLDAAGSRRIMVPFPKRFLKTAVGIMEKTIPNPPVTQSLLELLQVDNVTTENAIHQFVEKPRAFTADAMRGYMKDFGARDTLAQLFERT